MTQADVSDSPSVKVLSPETIAKEQASASRGLDPIPDEPSESQAGDVVSHDSFNSMASKLEAEMKKVMANQNKDTERTTAPDASDKKTTDSKLKPDAKAAQNDVKAQEKASEKPVEPEIPETFTSAKAADWKALKSSRDEARKQADELKQNFELTKKEYEEFRKKVGDPAQTELTKKQLAELSTQKERLEAELKAVALERSESFSSHYKKQFDSAISKAKDAVGESNAEKVESLLNLPPTKWRKERLNEIREELDGIDQGQLDRAIDAYDTARNEREAQLKDSKTNYERLQQMNVEKANQERKAIEARSEAALSAVLSFAQENMESFKRTDDKDHNAFVDQATEFTSKYFKNQLNDTEKAMLPVLTMEAKRLTSTVVPSLQAKIKELEEALKEYKSGTPGTASGSTGNEASNRQPKDFISTYNELWPAGNR